MKLSNLLTLAGIIGVFTFSSCTKQPTANFTTDKDTYTAGETIKCTNTSTNGTTYLWTFDSKTYTEKDPSIVIPASANDQTVSLKLIATSKNGKKTDETSKSITIKAATGGATYWVSESHYNNTNMQNVQIKVTLNGVEKMITTPYATAPPCNAAGCANFTDVKAGTYPYQVEIKEDDGGVITTFTVSGNVTISAGICHVLEIFD
ncbi:MAG: hypothetical protein H0X63_09225 [Flavobacteriales bacterium]|nr:hypothetical protein [Flavobacteriales bacterium]